MPTIGRDRDRELAERLTRLGIREEDLEEHFVRARGKGGQNVNKVSTCVVLRHVSTGVQVKCDEGRSQAFNRHRARVLLAEKLEARNAARDAAITAAAERARRQRRQPSRKAKAKNVAAKRSRSQIKRSRSRPREDE